MSYTQALELRYTLEDLLENETKNAKKIAAIQAKLRNAGY